MNSKLKTLLIIAIIVLSAVIFLPFTRPDPLTNAADQSIKLYGGEITGKDYYDAANVNSPVNRYLQHHYLIIEARGATNRVEVPENVWAAAKVGENYIIKR